MPVFEKKILEWFHSHMGIFFLGVLFVLALFIRLPLCSLHAEVPGGSGWGRIMLFGDYLLAVVSALLCNTFREEGRGAKSMAACALMLVSFGNIFASAVYGRMDAIWVSLCILAMIALIKDKDVPAVLALSLACFISAYAFIFLPFIFFDRIKKERAFIFALAAPAAAGAFRYISGIYTSLWLPEGFAAGQMYAAYPGSWCFLAETQSKQFGRYMPLACVITLVMIAVFIILFCRKRYVYDGRRVLWAAFLLSFIAAEFLPGTGMGAAALPVILAWIIGLTEPVLLIPAFLMEGLRIWPQAAEIYGREWMAFSIQGLAWIQMALMLFYLLYYHKKVLDAAK